MVSTTLTLTNQSPTAAPHQGASSPACLLKILHSILLELDLESLSFIRCLGTLFKDIADSLPAYKALAIFATDALRALALPNILSHYSVGQLYATLKEHRCTGCSSFGSFLFTPTGRRYCFSCIETNPEMDIVFCASAKKKLFGLSEKEIKQAAVIATVTGHYGLSQKPHLRRT